MSESEKHQKIAGVLGGMGPAATVDFMDKVVALTPAARDQEHVRMLVDHNPHVPDRTAAIVAGGPSPGPVLAGMAAELQESGADFIVIPCNTAHAFAGDIEAAITIPLISIIDVSMQAVQSRCPGAARVGVLATRGTLAAGLFQRAITDSGGEAILPDDGELDELSTLIAAIKDDKHRGDLGPRMQALAEAQIERGAEAIIAGCTELPLVLRDEMIDVPLVSTTDELAAVTVKLALGELPLPGPDQES